MTPTIGRYLPYFNLTQGNPTFYKNKTLQTRNLSTNPMDKFIDDP